MQITRKTLLIANIPTVSIAEMQTAKKQKTKPKKLYRIRTEILDAQIFLTKSCLTHLQHIY